MGGGGHEKMRHNVTGGREVKWNSNVGFLSQGGYFYVPHLNNFLWFTHSVSSVKFEKKYVARHSTVKLIVIRIDHAFTRWTVSIRVNRNVASL